MTARALEAVPAPGVSEADAASFHVVRSRLFGIAYRVLGSATEADDVVQEAWIRWQSTDRAKVRDAPAFLATTTLRLAINVAHSARARRETHIGLLLVERVDVAADPSLDAEREEALECAMCTLVHELPPAERAAYLLREAFDYPYRRISRVLALSEANSRQLVTRARRRLEREPHRPARTVEHPRLLDVFAAAVDTGDLAPLERLLAADVALRVAA